MNDSELRGALEYLGWSRAELARRINADVGLRFTRQYVNNMANGHIDVSSTVAAYVVQAVRLKECEDRGTIGSLTTK